MALKDIFKIFDKERMQTRKRELDFAKAKHAEVSEFPNMIESLCADFEAKCNEMIERCNDKYKDNQGRKTTKNGLEMFEATQEEIESFIETFIDVAIPNEALKQRLKAEMHGFDVMDKLKDNGVCGSVGPKIDNGRVVGVNKEIYLGDKLPNGKISTNMHNIQTYIHEIFHAVSSKHDVVRNDRGETHLKHQAYSEIGETESMFSEQLFVHILKTQSDKFKVDGKLPFGFEDDTFEKDITILDYDGAIDFFDRSRMVGDDKHFEMGRKKEEQYRYIVGMVGANVLMEKYMQNPEEACRFLETFLKHDHILDKESSIKVLSGGSVESYKGAVDKLKQKFAKKVTLLSSEELDEEKRKIEEENPTQEVHFEPVKARNKQGNENEQENDIQIEK